MIVLNFAHPTTDEQREQLRALIGEYRLIEKQAQFDLEAPLAPQVKRLFAEATDGVRLSDTLRIAIVPPGYAPAAAFLAAWLADAGYYVHVVRVAPVPNVTPPRFRYAEVIDVSREDEVFVREED